MLWKPKCSEFISVKGRKVGGRGGHSFSAGFLRQRARVPSALRISLCGDSVVEASGCVSVHSLLATMPAALSLGAIQGLMEELLPCHVWPTVPDPMAVCEANTQGLLALQLRLLFILV